MKQETKVKINTKREMIADELNRIAERKNGLLYPADVVSVASNPQNILHGCFEWDDKKAGHEYRIWQSRILIKTFVIVESFEGNAPVNAFVSLSTDRTDGGGYRTLISVMHDKKLKNILLSDAIRDMEFFKSKYYTLESYLGTVFKEMDKVKKKIK